MVTNNNLLFFVVSLPLSVEESEDNNIKDSQSYRKFAGILHDLTSDGCINGFTPLSTSTSDFSWDWGFPNDRGLGFVARSIPRLLAASAQNEALEAKNQALMRKLEDLQQSLDQIRKENSR